MHAFGYCIIMEASIFDVDVELIKPIDDILARGAFMGCEKARI